MNDTTADKATLQEMMDSACHFGHRVSKWNPKMRRFIHGSRNGVHVLDLAKSHRALEKAMRYLTDEVYNGKVVLLVCTKLQAKRLMEQIAARTGMPYVTSKWIPGLLTNYKTLRKRINYLRDLKEKEAAGDFERYTKKEGSELRKMIDKLQMRFGGVENLSKVPDIMVVGDGVRDINAIREARRMKIPVVGIVDSNADPDMMDFPVPGNDDAIKSLTFFMTKFADAIVAGKKTE